VTEPPNDTAEPLIVMAELVRLELAMLLSVFVAPEIDLFVRVFDDDAVTVMSLVKATVPVVVGKVKVPVLLIVEIIGVVSVLFVSVSVVARPTSVSVEVGRVKVPLLLMLEITGVVKVLFDKVCAVVVSTVVVVSIESVTEPDDPPPERPVPAVTPVMSPAPM
jgi:hypothetical protein